MSCVKSQPAIFDYERVLPPWEIRPYGVVSLLDMLRLYADMFAQALFEMHEMEVKWPPSDRPIPAPEVVAAKLVGLEMESLQHGLSNTAQKCGRIKHKCHSSRPTFREIVADLKELRERLEDELQTELFLHLSTQEGRLYEMPDEEWKSVVSRFSKVRHDIIECSKCFALGRYGAAVFHVMLVAEYGIIQVASLFGVAGDKPGWGALDRLQRINDKQWNDKTPAEQEHSKFLENLLPLAFAMKESWRHKLNHVANKIEWMDTDFSPEVASDIISATRGFMRRLATDLPK
jgi:hypothetical protein